MKALTKTKGIAIVLAVFLLAGLSIQQSGLSQSKKKIARPVDSNRSFDRAVFQADYDLTWQTLFNILGEYAFDFTVKDRTLGKIETAYVVFSRNSRFSKLSAGVKAFATPPRLFMRKWIDGRMKVHAEIQRLSDSSIQVILRPDIQGWASTLFDDSGVTGEWHQCTSNGKFEFEVFNEIATQLKNKPLTPPPPPISHSAPPSTHTQEPRDTSSDVTTASNLMLQSIPEGAEIYLNDTLVGMTPSRISLPPGEYKVIFRREGYKDYQREFVILRQSDLTVSKELDPK